jgi:hypothetical protein
VIDETQIDETLRQLGDDANAVAASLRERGVKGVVGKAEQCPIANLLRQVYDADIDELEVEWNDIRVHCRDNTDPYESLWIDPPLAVGKFIVQFDSLAFPDLIESGEAVPR